MKPVHCMVRDEPANGNYGDCVRACVASILELNSDQVPHFYASGDGDEGFLIMREYLQTHGRIPAYFPLAGNLTFESAMDYMRIWYPETEYLLYCTSGDGDHCVCGRGGVITHDPSWYRTAITGPHSSGFWLMIVLAKL